MVGPPPVPHAGGEIAGADEGEVQAGGGDDLADRR
jgi:hypothetical protein